MYNPESLTLSCVDGRMREAGLGDVFLASLKISK